MLMFLILEQMLNLLSLKKEPIHRLSVLTKNILGARAPSRSIYTPFHMNKENPMLAFQSTCSKKVESTS